MCRLHSCFLRALGDLPCKLAKEDLDEYSPVPQGQSFESSRRVPTELSQHGNRQVLTENPCLYWCIAILPLDTGPQPVLHHPLLSLVWVSLSPLPPVSVLPAKFLPINLVLRSTSPGSESTGFDGCSLP